MLRKIVMNEWQIEWPKADACCYYCYCLVEGNKKFIYIELEAIRARCQYLCRSIWFAEKSKNKQRATGAVRSSASKTKAAKRANENENIPKAAEGGGQEEDKRAKLIEKFQYKKNFFLAVQQLWQKNSTKTTTKQIPINICVCMYKLVQKKKKK